MRVNFSFLAVFLMFVSLFGVYGQIESQSGDGGEDPKRYYKAALSYFEKGMLEQARECYEKAIGRDPDNFEYNYELGLLIYHDFNDKRGAIPYLEHARDHASAKQLSGELFYYLGKAYQFTGETKKALLAYERFVDFLKDSKYGSELKDEINLAIEACLSAREPSKFDNGFVSVANLGTVVNSSFADYAPVIDHDEDILLYTSRRRYNNVDGVYYEDIYASEKKQLQFKKSKTIKTLSADDMSEDNFNYFKSISMDILGDEKFHNAIVGLSPIKDQILIYKRGKLWLSNYTNGKWSMPVKLEGEDDFGVYQPHGTMTGDGMTIYMSISNNKKQKNLDIYKSESIGAGLWSKPVSVGDKINTKFNEDSPEISSDGKVLFFSSRGHGGFGGYDIYMSVLGDQGEWSEPVNLGEPVNSVADDIYYKLNAKGNRAYFASNRDGGYGDMDIYSAFYNVTVFEDQRPFPNDQKKVVSLNANGLIPNDRNLLYEWAMGDNNYLLGKEIEYSYQLPGEYDVALYVVDTLNKKLVFKKDGLKVNVDDYTHVDFNCPDTVEVFRPVLFDASPTRVNGETITRYIWNFNDNTMDDSVKVYHKFKSLGRFKVQMSAIAYNNQTKEERYYLTEKFVTVLGQENYISYAIRSKKVDGFSQNTSILDRYNINLVAYEERMLAEAISRAEAEELKAKQARELDEAKAKVAREAALLALAKQEVLKEAAELEAAKKQAIKEAAELAKAKKQARKDAEDLLAALAEAADDVEKERIIVAKEIADAEAEKIELKEQEAQQALAVLEVKAHAAQKDSAEAILAAQKADLELKAFEDMLATSVTSSNTKEYEQVDIPIDINHLSVEDDAGDYAVDINEAFEIQLAALTVKVKEEKQSAMMSPLGDSIIVADVETAVEVPEAENKEDLGALAAADNRFQRLSPQYFKKDLEQLEEPEPEEALMLAANDPGNVYQPSSFELISIEKIVDAVKLKADDLTLIATEEQEDEMPSFSNIVNKRYNELNPGTNKEIAEVHVQEEKEISGQPVYEAEEELIAISEMSVNPSFSDSAVKLTPELVSDAENIPSTIEESVAVISSADLPDPSAVEIASNDEEGRFADSLKLGIGVNLNPEQLTDAAAETIAETTIEEQGLESATNMPTTELADDLVAATIIDVVAAEPVAEESTVKTAELPLIEPMTDIIAETTIDAETTDLVTGEITTKATELPLTEPVAELIAETTTDEQSASAAKKITVNTSEERQTELLVDGVTRKAMEEKVNEASLIDAVKTVANDQSSKIGDTEVPLIIVEKEEPATASKTPVTNQEKAREEVVDIGSKLDTNYIDPNQMPKLLPSFALETIYFGFDKSYVTGEAAEGLDRNIRQLKENPTHYIKITAHTDVFGPEEYNKILSERRARSVVKYLVEHGISNDRIVAVVSKGESQPVFFCEENRTCSVEEHRKNRRAELQVMNPVK